ncbi:MAG TPA: DUF177 domain-containing protein [Solirubrobacteraceae bacterium]|jgi:uncharacterized protein|nr:DUF177 domain-containing protein [Solirubrobacteraceae bacterium]
MARTDVLDLGGLRLTSGEGRRLELEVAQEPLELAGQRYAPVPDPVAVTVDVSRTTGGGYALRLRLSTALEGPCMRCLEPAAAGVEVDAREVELPGGGDELDSPYVDGDSLDLGAWVHDAVALAAPDQLLCRPDCPGLCPICAIALASAPPDHHHDSGPDPRWAKLRELDLG